MSLGVDLVPPKTCSLNCIYCESGRTTNLTLERKEYVPYEGVITELTDFLTSNPAPDYITFSGSGEPTLNSRIGDVIQHIKQQTPGIPVAVITNGTLLSDQQVRSELLQADLVMPSLDAASELFFKKINRPHHFLSLTNYLNGLAIFKKEFKGEYWLEIFIVPGYNDSEKELRLLKQAIHFIQPDRIQINSLDRPGAVSTIKPATIEELQQITDYLQFEPSEIISSNIDRKKFQVYREDVESTILETISRRPCTLEDLSKILGLHIKEVNRYIRILLETNKISVVNQTRGSFYQIQK
jgi:wyosine [tRNA(Phe)-imidazoG37] synthetase (radical SAM superfamily)